MRTQNGFTFFQTEWEKMEEDSKSVFFELTNLRLKWMNETKIIPVYILLEFLNEFSRGHRGIKRSYQASNNAKCKGNNI